MHSSMERFQRWRVHVLVYKGRRGTLRREALTVHDYENGFCLIMGMEVT